MDRHKQLYSVQVLRGLAAAAVLLAHTYEHPRAESPNAVTMLGVFGVQVFFVISGFIIAYVNADGPFRPVDFLIKRLFRIVPLYWLCTILVFFCALYLPSLFKTTVADTGYFLKSLFFIPSAAPNDPNDWRPLFKLGWSLNYEMFFYVVFALFWWCRSALQRTAIMSVLFGLCVVAGFSYEPSASVQAFYLNTNLLTFVCGMWLAEAEKRGLWDRTPVIVVGLIAVAALFLLWTTFTTPLVEFRKFHVYLFMCGAAVAIVMTALTCERWAAGLKGGFLVQLGAISYSLYLTHMFVVGFGWAVLRKLNAGPALEIAGMAAIVVTALVGAQLSYRLLEMPPNRIGHRLTRRFAGRPA